MARRIIVTGPSGFVGRHLCQDLARRGYTVIAIARRPDPDLAAMDVTVRPVADLAGATAQELGLRDADTVVHLAGRAHVMGDRARDSSDLYFRNNVETTRVLSEQSTQSGVARFIFLSSVKVFGDGPFVAPLKPSTRPKPADAYGRSKLEAEDWLLGLDRHSAPDVVIVRPPLIYGPGVRANFLQLIRLVERGIPLPFARVNNLRSFVNVGNLCDLMVRLIEERDTARGIYHVADAEDCSTAELIREIAVLMGKPARLFACPEWLLRAGMALIGRSLVYQRLVGSLQLDISGTESMLGWRPPVSRRDGLAQTLSWYFGTKARTGS